MAVEQISEADGRSLGSLSERYAITSILGKGAFATVYLADDLQKGRPVVIKLLGVADSSSDSAIFRFHAEVAATRLLQHKNLVRVLSDGVTDDHRPYLITEYTPGRSLAAVLRESGKLPIHHAINVGIGIARALAYVHGQKFVHRDLKPSNVLIPGWPEAPDYDNPKLLDFGVVGRLEQGRTQAGMIFGTLRYMSPEQIKGERQSPATDVYGFGLLLFEMLTGAAPSNRDRDLATLLIAIRDGIPAKDLEAIPPDLADLIRKCAQSDPADRPAMTDVLSQLTASPHRFVATGGEASPDKTGFIVTIPFPSAAAPGPSVKPADAPAQTADSTLILSQSLESARAVASPGADKPAPSRAGGGSRWVVLAGAIALVAIAVLIFFRPGHVPANPPHNQVNTVPPESKTGPIAAPAPQARSNEAAFRAIRFSAGLLLAAASIAIAFWLRMWLGGRTDVKSQAYELVFGAKVRTDLTATIALQLDELVSKLRRLDERILAGSVALMLNEYGSATDTKDRQAALMNVVALSEKLALRLSPWYERYKEVIASAVAVMGGVSGLVTALNSVLSHKH